MPSLHHLYSRGQMKVRGPLLGAAAVGAPAVAILLTVVHLASQSPRLKLWAATRSRPARSSFDSAGTRIWPDCVATSTPKPTGSSATAASGMLCSRSKNVQTLITQLAARPDVLYAEPNYLLCSTLQPNDPRLPDLWNLLNVGQTVGGIPGTPGADIHATDAWDTAIGARGPSSSASLDTGVDYRHPDLAANVWSAPAQFTITVGGCIDHLPAGTHGFNAITKTCDPFDDHFHGTHVSGTSRRSGQ